MKNMKIRFEKVTKRYDPLVVLDELDFEVADGEVVSIIGPSGSGKTTVLRVLMTLEGIQGGTMYIDGEPLNKMRSGDKLVPATGSHIRKIRSRIGMVFQNFNLFPHMTALKNCIEAPVHSLRLDKNKAEARAMKLLESVGLADKYNHYPSELSGGQQQRVAIARTLSMKPEILLFDEPTSALDPEMVGEVLSVIRRLASEKTYTILMVSHAMGFVREVSDRVCFFDGGKIIEQGPPNEIFGSPQQERLKEFLSMVLDVH